jgi:hypothetical protein
MTERRPSGMSHESWVDRQIRDATDRGEFDNLPGAGKPIPGAGRPDDEHWWLREYVRREGLSTEPMLPTPLRLRKEIERLPETVRALRTEQAVRDEVAALNARIRDYLRTPSGPQIPVRLVRADEIVAAWRGPRRTPPTPHDGPGPPGPQPPVPRRRRWWRRAG